MTTEPQLPDEQRVRPGIAYMLKNEAFALRVAARMLEDSAEAAEANDLRLDEPTTQFLRRLMEARKQVVRLATDFDPDRR